MTGCSFIHLADLSDVTSCENKVNTAKSIYVLNLCGPDLIEPGDIYYVTHKHLNVRGVFESFPDVIIRTLSATQCLVICQ